MADNMAMDDMSFADLLDTCQAHLKRPRTEVESSQGDRKTDQIPQPPLRGTKGVQSS